ncbi:RsmB/NOP family class I SAM-dependent RNA methyltransferase [Jatrophihabitans endophyticus]|uniref:RsmB/NOP family class I SAM-dependent RNA methyltransferase n=1 Tax=Jatrophihabitans endophyticus TaxID=1206085 RepID=UPI0019FD3FDF|nr:transcription antitermination factor NusB [Jatrophihabitans endophyticus]MBE7189102.1 rRNA small subunit methyltransferase B [Jatrophihabitans endophyticus]
MPERRGPRRPGSGPGRGRPARPPRPPAPDPARTVAYELLRAVDADDAYANLVLPRLLTGARLDPRDAGLATELGYGTLRALGTLDAVLGRCADRPLGDVDPGVLDLLRLGTYQALYTRVPPHAAVASVVDLARLTGNGRAGGFVNAVLRRVTSRDRDAWTAELVEGLDPLAALAVRTAHPEWIADAFARALGESDHLDETARALEADDARPVTHLVAWPGRSGRDELLAAAPGSTPGPYSPYAVRMAGGVPGDLDAVRERRAGVQDEGSQLCALALAAAPIDGRDERWLDLCAGPGGKAALLAALAAERGATLTANELRPHRADLVRRVTSAWGVEVTVGDGRTLPRPDGGYDRVLLDAPCTGLGALRRRPEARWRRRSDDVPGLAGLQRELLGAALRLTRPGGVVAYVTCSPHPAETLEVVAGHRLLDARPLFPGVPDLGEGPTVQLWPHRHGTDAMFCALVRR